MPKVIITVRRNFMEKVPDPARMCRGIRKVVRNTFGVKLGDVSVKDLEHYAPGCEARRPLIVIEVSINRGDRTSRHEIIAKDVAVGARIVVDEATNGYFIGRNVGKLISDLVDRKTVRF